MSSAETIHFITTSRRSPFPYCHLSFSHRGLDFKRQSKLQWPSLLMDPSSCPCNNFGIVHHGLKWPVLCFSRYFSSSFGPAGAGHDHMRHILGQISTLATWIIYSWNFSSVRIGIEPNVFASYLYGCAVLGPAQVSMDTERCSSLAHSCLSRLFTCN